jgi:hypothetical protein
VHFSEIILGVKQLTPGWTNISFDPMMTKGEKAEGIIPTPHGLIRVKWDWTGHEAYKNISVPAGIEIIASVSSIPESGNVVQQPNM